jgi:hypothetical protein
MYESTNKFSHFYEGCERDSLWPESPLAAEIQLTAGLFSTIYWKVPMLLRWVKWFFTRVTRSYIFGRRILPKAA